MAKGPEHLKDFFILTENLLSSYEIINISIERELEKQNFIFQDTWEQLKKYCNNDIRISLKSFGRLDPIFLQCLVV